MWGPVDEEGWMYRPNSETYLKGSEIRVAEFKSIQRRHPQPLQRGLRRHTQLTA